MRLSRIIFGRPIRPLIEYRMLHARSLSSSGSDLRDAPRLLNQNEKRSGGRTAVPAMLGARLPGDSSVVLGEYPVPQPRRNQVLIRVKASMICEGEILGAYRQHLDQGDHSYEGVICGHEISGAIENVGPDSQLFSPGDRVIVARVSGCGECADCRQGNSFNCSGTSRAVYGSQRDGGMAEFLLAEERDCVRLPENLCHADGANIACAFGTAWEALKRMAVVVGERLLVTGAGPTGLAAMMLARSLGVSEIIVVDPRDECRTLAEDLGLADATLDEYEPSAAQIIRITEGKGCEVAIDCSGDPLGRVLSIRGAARWGRVAFVGEGNSVLFEPTR
ncbi:MAG TPA: alcohol dehydrogenase catalytic domain-containing protein, partial [Spirochaetia bacterium]|nr:alcohol dehydrogenase catalytic domain-containing protein [Spirochaetia bacterium]